MATLQDVQEKLQEWKNEKTVLLHLIEYLDAHFRSSGGEKAKNVLLGDNKLPIPEEAFEEVITEILMKSASALELDITRVMTMPLTSLYPQPLPAHEIWPVPGPAVPPVPKEEIKQAVKAAATPAPVVSAVGHIPIAPNAPIPYQPVAAPSPPAEAVQPKKNKGKGLN
jgi:hypothetical protein